jgi:integrase
MWLQPHVDGFRSWLAQRSYSPATTVEVIRLLALWGDWVHAAGLSVSASVFQGGKTARAPQGAATLFISYLRERDILPQEQPSSLKDTWPTLAAFRRWMKEQRGIKDSTLDTYQPVLIDLLALLGTAPEAYTAAAIRDFVLERAKPHGRGRAQGVTVATRAYLRYLVAIGQCPVGREHAVPRFASWQLATTPRFLAQDDIERLLAECDGESRLRDRAIQLLLVRLGLRVGEVANLNFGDVDWKNSLISLVGKARREEHLPLTQEIGDAMLAYIERARPRSATARVFLTYTDPGPADKPYHGEVYRAARARQGQDQKCSSQRPCSPALGGVSDVAERREPRWRRRRSTASLAIRYGALRQGGYRPPVGDCSAMGREVAMLNDDVDRYTSLRHALGYKLVKAGRHLRAFACFAADRGETHIGTRDR